jgi:hypothetical protein
MLHEEKGHVRRKRSLEGDLMRVYSRFIQYPGFLFAWATATTVISCSVTR